MQSIQIKSLFLTACAPVSAIVAVSEHPEQLRRLQSRAWCEGLLGSQLSLAFSGLEVELWVLIHVL